MSCTAKPPTLIRSPFHQFHIEHGAKMVEFAGWEMPMLYGSIIQEHRQVRRSGGIFDVSHMGRLRFTGPDARRFLDLVCTRRIDGMADGQCRYSILCNERGGCRDDTLVYRLGEDEYLMVCNAANRLKLLDHFQQMRGDLSFDLSDETMDTAMLAIQGPKVIELIGAFAPAVRSLKRYRFLRMAVLGVQITISRTGYSGEDGVEVILPAPLASGAISLLVSNVDSDDAVVKPAGLGARDTLRTEAAMPLYGHEITEEIDPLSAGLNFAVTLEKGDDRGEVGHFIGQKALNMIAGKGPPQRLVGLILNGKRTARQGMAVLRGDIPIGRVTSACLSPTLGWPIAMAYLDAKFAEPGGTVQIELARTTEAAEVVKLPFYKAR